MKWWERWYAHQRTREDYDEECLEAIAMRRAYNKFDIKLQELDELSYMFVIGCLAHDLENGRRVDAWVLFDENVKKFSGKTDA